VSDIVIQRRHALTPAKAKKAAEKIALGLEKKFDLRHEWEANVLHFKRSGVSGELTLHKREVEIRVRLGFLLMAIRPTVEQEIHRYFDENFGHEGTARV
jgi:putative polyhydroxyalkanoate system protein